MPGHATPGGKMRVSYVEDVMKMTIQGKQKWDLIRKYTHNLNSRIHKLQTCLQTIPQSTITQIGKSAII